MENAALKTTVERLARDVDDHHCAVQNISKLLTEQTIFVAQHTETLKEITRAWQGTVDCPGYARRIDRLEQDKKRHASYLKGAWAALCGVFAKFFYDWAKH